MSYFRGAAFRGGLSVSGIALALAISASAHAQEAGAEATELDAVVVRGQRLANQRAIDAKREADAITDVIAADDLNRLPDQNLAEALSRAPGLSSFQDEGAGLYVGIRGLNQEFVNVTIDGLEFSSASRTFDANLRGANLEAVPSTFVSKVEVIKAVTPDLDGDAIAGTVNLVTRSALDANGPWLRIGGSFGRYEVDVPPDDVGLSGKGNLSFGTTFGGDTVGLVIDANFRDIRRDNLKPKGWFGAVGDGRGLPEEVGGFFYQRREESWGLTGKLEFRPSDRWQAFITANYFDSAFGIDKTKHALFGAVSNPQTGLFTRAVATARHDDIEYGVDGALTVGAGLDLFATERDTISLQGSTSSSTSYQDDPRVDWHNAGPLSGAYAFDGQSYSYRLDPASQQAFDNPANYVFNGYRRFQESLVKDVDVVKLDWRRRASGDQGFGFGAGAKWRETGVDYTASNFRWDRPVGAPNFERFLFTHDYAFPYLNNPVVILSDVGALAALAEEMGPSGFSRRRSVVVNGNDYDITERVNAAYGLVDYTSPSLRIVGGLRYEDTRTNANNRFNYADDAPFINTSGGYDNWLPSLAATWFINDRLLLRAGLSRTLGRPDIRDLARGETPPNDNGYFERGNPDLKPRLSDNLDASLEYYFDGGRSLVSVAVFHKAITDEIFNLQTPYTFTNELGANVQAFFVQPQNGGDAKITGVEIGVVKDRFDFLPGPLSNLGFSANLTFNSGDFDLLDAQGAVLRTVNPEGLSRRLANATLYYQGERFSARAAWRYASAQTQALSLDGSGDLLLDAYQQTDLHFGYQLTDRIEIFGEAWNVFENEQTFTNANLVSGTPNWFEQVRYGRALWLGVNLKF